MVILKKCFHNQWVKGKLLDVFHRIPILYLYTYTYPHPCKYNGNTILYNQGINRLIKVGKSCKLWNEGNIGF